MISCTVCGARLDFAQVLYSTSGDVICQACLTASQVREGHAKSASAARSAAYGNVALGIASFFWNPLFTLSAASIGNVFFVFRRISDDTKRGEPIPDAAWRKAAAIAGAVLGTSSLIVRFL